MEKGFNTDIRVGGITYHVQTEDWGQEHQFVVTRVFRGGAIVKTFKIRYSEFSPDGPASESLAIRLAMQEQHQIVIDQLSHEHI